MFLLVWSNSFNVVFGLEKEYLQVRKCFVVRGLVSYLIRWGKLVWICVVWVLLIFMICMFMRYWMLKMNLISDECGFVCVTDLILYELVDNLCWMFAIVWAFERDNWNMNNWVIWYKLYVMKNCFEPKY